MTSFLSLTPLLRSIRHTAASLRFRLILVVLIALLPALLLALRNHHEQLRLARQAAEGNALDVTRVAVASLDGVVKGTEELLVALAGVPQLYGDDRAACGALLDDMLGDHSAYAGLGVLQTDGTLRCQAVRAGEVLPADAAHLARTLRTGDFTVGDYHIGSTPGAATLSMAYPLSHPFPDGGRAGAVVAALDLSKVNRVASEARLPAGSLLMVVDENGTVLARDPDPERWVGKVFPPSPILSAALKGHEGSAEGPGVDGVRRLFAFSALKGSGGLARAHLMVGIPTEVAFLEAGRELRHNLMLLALLAVVVLGATALVGEMSIIRPFRAVLNATRRLSSGDLDARVGPIWGGGDLGGLAADFDAMAAALHARRRETEAAERELRAAKADLQRRVSERTLALTAANERLKVELQGSEVRSRQIALLGEMADLLHSCRTAEESYDVVARGTARLFPEDAGALYTITHSRNVVETAAAWGGPVGEKVFTPDECWGLRRGQPHLVRDRSSDLVCRHARDAEAAVLLCVPLVANGQAVGILHLRAGVASAVRFAGDEKAGEAWRRLATMVAEQVALAMANVTLRETLRNQAIRDPLTGLFNRRYMEESLDRELLRAARRGSSLGVVKLDLDRFKDFNDSHGHAGGDALLRELGAFLRSSLRAEDIACRYGGEEFTLILPDASLEHTRARAEELREAIRRLSVQHQDRLLAAVTLSLGVAAFPEHGDSADELLAAADKALYLAKAGGRDRVTLAAAAGGVLA